VPPPGRSLSFPFPPVEPDRAIPYDPPMRDPRDWLGPLERASRSIAGHELDPCPLEHPLVGRLRCGEWFLFAGVHDLMHLEQLAALEAGLDDGPVGGREIEPAAALGGRDDR
jgi:hypothetical protein